MTRAEFEPATPATTRPQTHVLARAATGAVSPGPTVNLKLVTLSGRVVIMLAIGPKVRGFKPGRWIFKGNKSP
jgi:hypothetical protein